EASKWPHFVFFLWHNYPPNSERLVQCTLHYPPKGEGGSIGGRGVGCHVVKVPGGVVEEGLFACIAGLPLEGRIVCLPVLDEAGGEGVLARHRGMLDAGAVGAEHDADM